MANNKWWEGKSKNKHQDIFRIVSQIEANDKGRANRMLIFARLYNNSEVMGLDPFTYSQSNSVNTLDATIEDLAGNTERLRYNLIASIIDTLANRISINSPRVVALPKRGDYDIHRKASKLEQFIEGIFYESLVSDQAQKMFLHSACFGTGILHALSEEGNVKIEWVLPSELKVDPTESMYGKPRQMHRIKHVDKQILIEKFPEYKDRIGLAGQIDQNYANVINTTVSDLVTICESWHLPSSSTAKDGRHVISLNTVDLLDEPYMEDDFPFVFFHWREPLFGFWGRGVVENILDIQLEVNTLLQRIQEAQFLCSNPITFVNTASNISKPHLTNEIGIIVPYTGAMPPQTTVFQSVHPEIYQHFDRLIQLAHESEGVSMMSTQSKNVLGPKASGAAIRELSDLEAGRFGKVSRSYEQCFVELAKRVVKLARSMYELKDGDLAFTVKGKDFIQTISWEDINLEEDQFLLKLGSSSSLPNTKAGKTQAALDWLEMGAITPEEFRDMVDLGDTDADNDLRKAPREYIRKIIDDILDFGITVEPEKYNDLNFGLKYAVLSYNKAQVDEAPDDRLDLLSQFIDKVKAKIKAMDEEMAKQQQAALPPGPPPMGPPPGLPPAGGPPPAPPIA